MAGCHQPEILLWRNSGGGYKWLTFIDSDDFISTDFLENLLKPTIENNDLDFVHGGCTNYWNKENQYTVEQDYESTISMDKILLLEKIRGLLPSKLFSATIVEKIRLRFDERVKIAEDMIFTIEYIRHVDKYSFIEEKGYFYRRYSGSATQSSVNRDYTSQLACFKHFNQAVSDYKDAYSIEHSEIRDMQLGESIVRTAINLYRGLYPRKERLNRLHSDFNVNELSLLKYVTRNKMEKILANILKNRHYRLFDAITSMLFYIKNILVCHSFK